MVRKLSLQEIATLPITQEISDSNQETGRYGTKSGVSWIIWLCIKVGRDKGTGTSGLGDTRRRT